MQISKKLREMSQNVGHLGTLWDIGGGRSAYPIPSPGYPGGSVSGAVTPSAVA